MTVMNGSAKIIVTMGRGGTGKTSFVALLARYLIGKKDSPLLLVDADPDQNLAEMVGVDLDAAGKKTISELMSETFIVQGGTIVGIPPSQRIENRIWRDGLYESAYFDLIAIGTKWVEGCYCMPDAALKNALGTISRHYRYILIDSPGGLEHLNRKIASDVDTIIDVMGPSSKSFSHVRRAYRIIRQTGIRYRQFFIVGGFAFPERLALRAAEETALAYAGTISHDTVVAEYALYSRSLLEMPEDSPACRSVISIAKMILNTDKRRIVST